MNFSNLLIQWYLQNKRDLPWRKAHEPYQIWLSEIMLQQTRIEQGLPYYNKFIETYPSVFHLANAPQEEVLKLWQGLGYYSRARNLHETAKYVAFELNGVFPGDYQGLLKLKGVGDYTASAIASICYNEPVAVVDGNVYRVLSRIFGVETPINSSQGKKEFKQLATQLLDKEDPANFNQGLMEFGALHCKPARPACDDCPFSDKCIALRDKKVKELPVKLRKSAVKKRFFNYLVLEDGQEQTLLEQRTGKGIWTGLYQFPLIETEELIDEEQLLDKRLLRKLASNPRAEVQLYNREPIVHKLSHQHLYTRFWLVKGVQSLEKAVKLEKVKEYPVPVLIANFLNEYLPEDYK